MVVFLPVSESVAKSAILVSIFSKAAIPPLLSISAKRNSLNQTSPRIGSLNSSLFTPTIKVLTKPKFGFPLIPIRNLLVLPDKELSNSSSNL